MFRGSRRHRRRRRRRRSLFPRVIGLDRPSRCRGITSIPRVQIHGRFQEESVGKKQTPTASVEAWHPGEITISPGFYRFLEQDAIASESAKSPRCTSIIDVILETVTQRKSQGTRGGRAGRVEPRGQSRTRRDAKEPLRRRHDRQHAVPWKERDARRIRDCMSANSKTSQTTPTGASSLGIAVIPGKCAISSVIGYYYRVITGFDLG